MFGLLWYKVLAKMLSSSLYTMLKLSKASSPQKLFDYDRVTLYKNFTIDSAEFGDT